MKQKTINRLVQAARSAGKRAYAPYSGFKVGAAVLASNNRIYTGANVENASYGLTVCAERVAIFKAVNGGARSIKALAIFTETEKPTPPCGACLQVISEFGVDPLIVLATPGETKTLTLHKLLPLGFKLRP